MITLAVGLLLAVVGFSHASLPVTAPSAIIDQTSSGSCPAQNDLEAARSSLRQNVSDIIDNAVIPILQQQESACGCNLPGASWQRLAFLELDNCPPPWISISSPVKACGRSSSNAGSCDAVMYPSNGTVYSEVCGRIIGLQKGDMDAYGNQIRTGGSHIDGAYIDGVSLTHGLPGSRKHVWSFANALYDQSISPLYSPYVCPCMYPNWTHTIPSFIGNNYFCATGTRPRPPPTDFYPDDPLWDGMGCAPSSTCCQFNKPPWFCRTLPNSTSDNLEVRLCSDEPTDNENIFVTHIEIYVK